MNELEAEVLMLRHKAATKYGPHFWGAVIGAGASLIGSAIGGGGKKSKGYNSKYTQEYEEGGRQGLYNSLGATYAEPDQAATDKYNKDLAAYYAGINSGNTVRAGGLPGNRVGGWGGGGYQNPVKEPEKPKGSWDFSNVGKPLSVADANKEYDYSGIDQAMAGYKAGPQYSPDAYKATAYTQNAYTPTSYTQNAYTPTSYNRATYNFADPENINQQSALQYGLASKNINRQGQDSLEQMRGAVGPRNAGLLAKLGANNQRGVSENLASMDSALRSNALNQILQKNQEQQMAQSLEDRYAQDFAANQNKIGADYAAQQNQFGANYAAQQNKYGADYAAQQNQFGADLASREGQFGAELGNKQKYDLAGLIKDYQDSLGTAGQNKIVTQENIRSGRQAEKDAYLNQLLDLYKSSAGQTSQNANAAMADATARRGQTLGFLGNVASSYSNSKKKD